MRRDLGLNKIEDALRPIAATRVHGQLCHGLLTEVGTAILNE
jgi:hypothetical protein